MKKTQKAILLGVSVLAFVLLFYHQDVALNFGLLALLIWLFGFNIAHRRKRDKQFWILTTAVFITSFSQMWYADSWTFVALFLTLLTYGMQVQFKRMGFVFYSVILAVNYIIFLYRFLSFEWFPKLPKHSNVGQKIVAFGIVPLAFLGVFLGVYTTGSDLFYNFFKNFKINIDLGVVLALTALGIFLFFNYWMIYIPHKIITYNNQLSFDFSSVKKTNLKPTFSGIDLNIERRSGEITLLLLNLLLIVFIATYNYEQFFLDQQISRLSSDTHTRVTTIIFSIIMAMGLILFYFKSTFNFIKNSEKLKKLAYLWLGLNSILVLSAFLKNGEYILYYGLTHKRIGVIIFLILCFIGMYYSFLKIRKKRTNYFLVTKMAWVFFYTMIISSTINFSWVITKYNLTFQENPDYHYLNSLDYNFYILSKNKENNHNWDVIEENRLFWSSVNSKNSVLSWSLYEQAVVRE